jgi:hypothetical protein
MSFAAQLRLDRVLACVLVLLTGPALLPATNAFAAESSGAKVPTTATRLSGFVKTHASVRVGGELLDAVTVLPRSARTVTVQYRRAGASRFTNSYAVKTSAGGRFDAALKPRAAGVWEFRLVVAATSRADRLVSPVRTVHAAGAAATTKLEGVDSTPASVIVGATVTDVVTVLPRSRRTVQVQARRPGAVSFETMTTGTTSVAGAFTAVYRPSTAGVWAYRLLVPASTTARTAVSPTRTVTVTQPSPTPTPNPTPAPTPTSGTVPAPTTAVLSLNGSTGSTAMQTVNLSEAFDVTGTHAGPGLSLLSGSLDYGDNAKDTFSGDPALWIPTDHQYTGLGPVTATLTVVDSAFVKVSTHILITVYDEPTATIDPVGSFEKGKPVVVHLTTTTPADTSFVDYDTFTVNGFTPSVTDDYVEGLGNAPTTRTFTFATAGTYTIWLDVSNNAGGFASYSVPVTITDPPKAP